MRNGWISDAPFTLNGTNISECTSYVYLLRQRSKIRDAAAFAKESKMRKTADPMVRFLHEVLQRKAALRTSCLLRGSQLAGQHSELVSRTQLLQQYCHEYVVSESARKRISSFCHIRGMMLSMYRDCLVKRSKQVSISACVRHIMQQSINNLYIDSTKERPLVFEDNFLNLKLETCLKSSIGGGIR
ncbi:hypothetical protein RB195_010159 [Necator americanus]|uniref:Uncharacterized protein n=1 Tax=Necator americanus TaxID=51031 RepID=A0ABR1CWR0_NECAM